MDPFRGFHLSSAIETNLVLRLQPGLWDRVWELRGPILRSFPLISHSYYASVAYNSDSSLLAFTDWYDKLHLYHPHNFSYLALVRRGDREGQALRFLTFRPRHPYQLMTCEENLYLWDLTPALDGDAPQKMTSFLPLFVDEIQWRPHREQFLTRSISIGLWDLETHKRLFPLRGKESSFRQFQIEPSKGDLVATICSREKIRLWDLRRSDFGRRVCRLTEGKELEFIGVAFSPDGNRLLTADTSSQGIKLWDLRTRRVERSLSLELPVRTMQHLLVSPCGTQLVFDGETGLTVCDLESGEEIFSCLASASSKVYDPSSSRDNIRLACYERGNLVICDTTKREKSNF